MARAREEIDTFTIPEGCRRRVYRPFYKRDAPAGVMSTKNHARRGQRFHASVRACGPAAAALLPDMSRADELALAYIIAPHGLGELLGRALGDREADIDELVAD